MSICCCRLDDVFMLPSISLNLPGKPRFFGHFLDASIGIPIAQVEASKHVERNCGDFLCEESSNHGFFPKP